MANHDGSSRPQPSDVIGELARAGDAYAARLALVQAVARESLPEGRARDLVRAEVLRDYAADRTRGVEPRIASSSPELRAMFADDLARCDADRAPGAPGWTPVASSSAAALFEDEAEGDLALADEARRSDSVG